MCLVSQYLPGVLADVEAQRAGAEINSDGHGFAIWLGPGEIHTQTSLDADQLITDFTALRSVYPDGPAVFHSRWVTSGAPGIDNAQPFIVPIEGGDGVFAHNGTIEGLMTEPEQKDWSDSRLIAARLFPLDFKWEETFLHDFLVANDSRGVIITPAGRTVRLGDWSKGAVHNGVFHSNYDFVSPPSVAGSVRAAKEEMRLRVRALAKRYHQGDKEAGRQMAWLLQAVPELGSGVCE